MTAQDSETPAGHGLTRPPLERLFHFIVARRWWVVAIYAVLLVPASFLAVKVRIDSAVDRLIVRSEPDYIVARDFEKVFGHGEFAVVLAEADDPYAPEVLRRIDGLQNELGHLKRLRTDSILSIYRRARASFSPTPAESQALRGFATGTDLFHRQGLVGTHHIAVALVLELDFDAPEERAATLDEIDRVVAHLEADPGPITAVRKVGVPYINTTLDREIGSWKSFMPLFVVFVVLLNLFLYRSWRALIAFLATLAVSAAFTVGYVVLTHGVFTIVSSLVPMTVLITCTATLVYVHSRFVECPPERSPWEHQIFALANKFLPSTASVFATAVGFAALGVSKIRPVRDMGYWVAVGLVFTWLAVFTLFPALQRILRTPTQTERRVSGERWFTPLAERLPRWTYRYRWWLVPGSLVLCGMGLLVLFGVPGVIAPMHLETSPLAYFNPTSRLTRDTLRAEELIGGQSTTEIWLKGPFGAMTDPEVIVGLDAYCTSLEQTPDVSSVVGLPSIARMLRYVGGEGDQLPTDPDKLDTLGAQIEALAPREPTLGRFLDSSFAQTHLVVLSKSPDYQSFMALERVLRERWQQTVQKHPALARIQAPQITGLGRLQAKIAYYLVPTLVESFLLSVVIIYLAFLVIFRNWAARIMAIIPSLFAILVMFIFMRLLGMTLNVATILIASIVLGTSENDQIHFFYHFNEYQQKNETTEAALRHALLVAGRAILFATLINAAGFLAFTVSSLPPFRQFGLLSSIAFLLSMIADFTALPAALWIVFRARPEATQPTAPRLPAPVK